MPITLQRTLIETPPLWRRRFVRRFVARMLPPVVQLCLGLLPPEWERP